MLAGKVITRLRGLDYNLNTVQDNIARIVEPLAQQAILDGNDFLSIPVVSNTAFTIAHQLGRPYVGYIVTRVRGANQITVRETSTTDKTKLLVLVPSATGTIDVRVW